MAAFVTGAVGADQQLGAGGHGALDLRLDLGALAGDTIGPTSVDSSSGSPTRSPRVLDEGRDEVVVDLARDVEALGRGADLAAFR